jgi:hypothetical protein
LRRAAKRIKKAAVVPYEKQKQTEMLRFDFDF